MVQVPNTNSRQQEPGSTVKHQHHQRKLLINLSPSQLGGVPVSAPQAELAPTAPPSESQSQILSTANPMDGLVKIENLEMKSMLEKMKQLRFQGP
ncbi:hypothetical protein I7I53_06991 [Histoplasma capsulatum var. duboisii H88]|nr:hypothetical protein I7I53_06991 [Histoplasma capsulatum var. duboisii H88]